MPELDKFMEEFCRIGADSFRYYSDKTDENPFDDMPEYFMSSYIFEKLPNIYIATLETTFSKLARWNSEAEKRTSKPIDAEEANCLLLLAERLGSARVDMVLFHGDINKGKSEYSIFALVEFKKYVYKSASDRDKLIAILPHVKTCPYGIVCGGCKVDDLLRLKTEARKKGDSWYDSQIGRFAKDKQDYHFCAQVVRVTR